MTNVFGYETGQEKLMPLQEVTAQGTSKSILLLSSFLAETASLIEVHGDAFGHEHFIDWCDKKGIANPFSSDFIICSSEHGNNSA